MSGATDWIPGGTRGPALDPAGKNGGEGRAAPGVAAAGAATLTGSLRERRGGQPAIRTLHGSMSYTDLTRLVDRIRLRLMAAGTSPGDRIVLRCGNSPEYIVGALGVMAAGCIVVPIADDVGPERLRYVVDVTTPRLALVSADDGEPRSSGAPEEITLRIDLASDPSRLLLDPGGASGDTSLDPSADLPAMILFSSGSTGRPKGVVLRQRQLWWSAWNLWSACGLHAEHRELIVSPLSHSGAWQRAAGTLLAGGCIVLPDGSPSITAMLEDVEHHRITGFYTQPPVLRYLLRTEPARVRSALRSCRSLEVGSAPIGRDELRRFLELVPGTRVFVHYGLTECSRATVLDTRAHSDKLHTVGSPRPGVEVAIRDAAGDAVEVGGTGEILLRGPQLADAYWRQPALTREHFVDGWVRTGDHGSLDGDGFLTFGGRRDDMIVSAGYSFFPVEVETELGPVPGLAEYQIAGLSDPRGMLGHLPCAFVVPVDPDAWSSGDLIARARRRLPPHMVPKRVIAVPSLPRTASGKPDRRRTVELYGSHLQRSTPSPSTTSPSGSRPS